MRLAASRTFCTAGNSSPINTAMMAITTSSSISVKPRVRRDGERAGNMTDLPKKDEERAGARRGPAAGHKFGRTVSFPSRLDSQGVAVRHTGGGYGESRETATRRVPIARTLTRL